MPGLKNRLTAALLTFTLGVAASMLWRSPIRRSVWQWFSRWIAAGGTITAGRTKGGVCEEWAKAEVVSEGLGWDLTYMSTLKRMGYCPGGSYCEEWAKPQLPVHKYLAEWQGDPIISSMEIELPDGHAAMGIIWFIRTKQFAYSWTFSSSDLDKPLNKQPFPPEHYDSAFETTACWKQADPPNREFGPEGYIGFLSLYKEGRARQMLLTQSDLYEGSKNLDEAQPGRFSRALLPLFRWAAEQKKTKLPG